MNRGVINRRAAAAAALAVVGALVFTSGGSGELPTGLGRPQPAQKAPGIHRAGQTRVTAAPLASAGTFHARVTRSQRNDTSAPLRTLRPERRAPAPAVLRGPTDGEEPAVANRDARQSVTTTSDPVVQTGFGGTTMPAPIQNFKGISNADNQRVLSRYSYPPDANGDVGAGYYVQIVNLTFAVWSTAGNRIYGPVATNTLWQGLGGVCESRNDGDPIVLYDQLANRWMIAQFALQYPSNFHECIAVSTTSDPTGAWYRYDFKYSSTVINDYPKFGVWPNGYYMSTNQFNASTGAWAGAGAVVYERAAMLAGQPAHQVYLDLGALHANLGGMLPTNFTGPTPPPAGAPDLYLQADDNAWGYPQDQLEIWGFNVDWTNPGNSTFDRMGILPVASFDSTLCSGSSECIPQPSTAQRLDLITDRLMNRIQYRNFGDYASLTLSQAVAGGQGQAAMRWYELQDWGDGWIVNQQGTYAPSSENRWMGSVAMDGSGDIALGYSVSSRSTYPSIRYTGRLATDPLNTMPQGERTLVVGGGSQTAVGRWGDYSSMSVDPSDNCTFWYTQEYYTASSDHMWSTRIGSFRFPSCGSGGGVPTSGVIGGSDMHKSFQSGLTFQVGWSASGGPSTYDVRYRSAAAGADFGPYVDWQTRTDNVSAVFTGGPGSTYCFSARATNDFGTSGWGPESCTAVPLDDSSLAARGRWTHGSGAGYYLGTYSSSRTRGSSLTLTGVRARQLSLIATVCPGCGSLGVFWNGSFVRTVRLGARTVARGRVVPLENFASAQNGTLKLVVLSSGSRVKVEGLGIARV